jgi:hypothetical protein
MALVKRSLVAIFFICLIAAPLAFGSASNIYITQSGAASGNCTGNVQTPAFFNNASNWGSGSSQIGPGTTVLICGAFTGSSNNQVVTAYVYDNYIHGDLGQGSPSGMIYCANNGVSGSGTGCALTAFNNVIVGTGSASANDQIIAVKLDASGANMGPINLYNNTFVGGAYTLELYNVSGGPSFAFTSKNNIFSPGDSSTTRWFIHQEDSGSPISGIAASNNLYYNGSSSAWNYNGGQYGALSAWQTACKCDASPSAVSNPNLSATYVPQTGSPVIGLGANLTSMDIASLNVAYNGTPRPSSGSCTPGVAGCWDAGANQFGGGSVVDPPTGLTAVVQ